MISKKLVKALMTEGPSRINDKIFLGDMKTANNKSLLQEIGITHVLVSAGELDEPFPETFKYKKLMLEDFHWINIKQHFNDCIDFMDQAEKILVHCAAGVSRSPSIVIAYFIKKEKMTFDEAFNFVSDKRPFINPNVGFIKQLKEFQAEVISSDREKK